MFTNDQNIIFTMSNIAFEADGDNFCYLVEDKGRTYRGHTSYTHKFKPCIKWSDAKNCRHSPYKPR